MQRMAELMEQGGDVVKAQQRRLAGGRLGEVAHVADHRFGTGKAILLDEHVHPRATGLAVALEVVGVEQRHGSAVGIEHLIHLHIRVIGRDVGALLEGDAVQLRGGVEDAVLQHVVQLEVRLDLRLVQVVLGLAHLLGVEVPIGRGELEIAGLCISTLRVDHLLHVGHFAARLGGGRRHGVGQQLERSIRRLGHLVAQAVGGVVVEAEQLGLLRAQLRQALDGLAGVVGIALFCACFRGLQHLGTQLAILQRGQHRLLGSVLQGEQILAIELAGLGGIGRGGDIAFAQAIELGLVVHHHRAGGRGGDQAGMELRGEGGFFHVELAQAVLVGIGQLRAGAYQLFVVALDQTLLLRVQIQRVALVVNGFDACEEFGVQIDLVLMRGQLGRDLFLDFLACVAGIGLHQPEEDARHARKRFATTLHRFDGVVEGGRLGLSAILRMSARCWRMPSSNAGR